ncbi:high-potential iron-sulfur protein [Thioalkalivibrio sp.]|uniref:high-potential iron-sulfur protein n=1 Tax=Thioalkalivibrio sp. TaxID=2093813 RepID=UPI003561E0C1
MRKHNADPTRRRLLRLGVAGIVAIPALPLIFAPAAANERVSEDDPQAKALHYRHDVSDVDHEAFEDGQNCANCELFSDPGASEWGPCEAFGGRLVATDGWCKSWVPRS